MIPIAFLDTPAKEVFPMDVRQLLYFTTIVEEGSISASPSRR